jgi:hypothetical protein
VEEGRLVGRPAVFKQPGRPSGVWAASVLGIFIDYNNLQ